MGGQATRRRVGGGARLDPVRLSGQHAASPVPRRRLPRAAGGPHRPRRPPVDCQRSGVSARQGDRRNPRPRARRDRARSPGGAHRPAERGSPTAGDAPRAGTHRGRPRPAHRRRDPQGGIVRYRTDSGCRRSRPRAPRVHHSARRRQGRHHARALSRRLPVYSRRLGRHGSSVYHAARQPEWPLAAHRDRQRHAGWHGGRQDRRDARTLCRVRRYGAPLLARRHPEHGRGPLRFRRPPGGAPRHRRSRRAHRPRRLRPRRPGEPHQRPPPPHRAHRSAGAVRLAPFQAAGRHRQHPGHLRHPRPDHPPELRPAVGPRA